MHREQLLKNLAVLPNGGVARYKARVQHVRRAVTDVTPFVTCSKFSWQTTVKSAHTSSSNKSLEPAFKYRTEMAGLGVVPFRTTGVNFKLQLFSKDD
jgi:hypothetical protein